MAVAMIVGATALMAISAIREGQQQSQIAKYNAKVAEAQSTMTGQTAAFESETLKKQSELEQYKLTREKQQALSTQRAQYAKAGVSLFEGSPLDVMADTAASYEMDLATGRYNLATGLESIRYEAQSKQALLAAESQYQKALAKSYKTTSYLKAGSTILSGGYFASKGASSGTSSSFSKSS